jgi:hypothetical protein
MTKRRRDFDSWTEWFDWKETEKQRSKTNIIINDCEGYLEVDVSTRSHDATMLIDKDDFKSMKKYGRFFVSINNGKAYVKQCGGLVHRRIMNARKKFVDHINGNGLDNRKSNLRLCTHAENLRNRKLNIKNKYGHTGIRCYKSKNKGLRWRAYISHEKKLIHIGTFDTREKAIEARRWREKALFGDFAPKHK